MNKQILIDLINQHKSTYEIAKELNKSQTNIRYWLKKYELKTKLYKYSNCTYCNKPSIKGTKYCSTVCKSSDYYKNNGDKIKENFKKDRVTFKYLVLEYCGKSCKHCGYNKNYAALSFHHLNSKDKNFNISSTKLQSFDKIKNELDKCITLCLNCHNKEHNNLNKLKTNKNKQTIKGEKIRQQFINQKEGKCKNCNIKSITSMFAFHHKDETTKLFEINARTCSNFAFERVKAEVEKCDLLCHNCHIEIHHPTCVF